MVRLEGLSQEEVAKKIQEPRTDHSRQCLYLL